MRQLHSVLGVIRWGDWSYGKLAQEMSDYEGRSLDPLAKSTVHNWSRRRDHKRYVKMPVEHRSAFAEAITNKLRELTQADYLIAGVRMNSPLRVLLYVRCENCQHRVALDLRRKNFRMCADCAKGLLK